MLRRMARTPKVKAHWLSCSSNLKYLKRSWDLHKENLCWILLFWKERIIFKWAHWAMTRTWATGSRNLFSQEHVRHSASRIHRTQWVRMNFSRWSCLRWMTGRNQVSRRWEALLSRHQLTERDRFMIYLADANESLDFRAKMVRLHLIQSELWEITLCASSASRWREDSETSRLMCRVNPTNQRVEENLWKPGQKIIFPQ